MRLPPQESHHAAHVLRLRAGDEVIVVDGCGRRAWCVLGDTSSEAVVARVNAVTRDQRVRPDVAVYQGAAKGTKVDLVTERLAALGVAELRVFSSQRSVVVWTEDKRRRLQSRWAAVAVAAAKQSRNAWVMATGAPLTWPQVVDAAGREPHCLVLWEDAREPLRAALRPAERVALIVGPEGGFAPEEVDELAAAGASSVSLGPRILRTEDAAMVAAAGVLWHFEAIG